MPTTASEIAVVVLAAGQGTRMKSNVTKVLHLIAGRPMLSYPLAAVEALAPEHLIVVVGRDADDVRDQFDGRATFVDQIEQRGTGHAVLQAKDALEGFGGDVLILYGDTPLLRTETLQRMVACKAEKNADLVMLTAAIDVPGIVIRGVSGNVAKIVEATDATPEELAIEERNTGVYLLGADLLWDTLARVGDDNAQGEIYLTTIVEIAVADGLLVEALTLDEAEEALGVNTRVELAQAAADIRRRVNARLMRSGVTLVDPLNTYIDEGIEIGRDTLIEPGCVIQGESKIGCGVHLKPHCVIESSVIGDDVEFGPSAHLRPNCVLGNGVRIGNFVEVKNSTLGAGTKAAHLSYIGDADVGEKASFGCGTIVVNYDGITKSRTRVGDRAFVGCNSNLIAPVTLENDTFVAAGSTVTHDVPEGALSVARARQRNVEGWVTRRSAAGSSEPGPTNKPSAKKKAKRSKAPPARKNRPTKKAKTSTRKKTASKTAPKASRKRSVKKASRKKASRRAH
jgi:bifunctional UDP-N-acetylglucosamine pyrophosphorylase/glucosamine-1-phosphate N-acetyltransferase